MADQGPVLRFERIGIERIGPNPHQPRRVFDEDELAELASSIRSVGILQPILVRPSQGDGDVDFELVAGERRWRAAHLAGLAEVPAVIRQTPDDDLLRAALVENIQRAQLNPLEEAAAYQQLVAELGCSHEELAAQVGRSRPYITNTIRLLRLPPGIQRRVAAGVLTQGHARALLSLDSPEQMEELATRIVAEGLSVRAVEELVILGQRAKPKRSRPAPQPGAQLDEVARSLMDRLDTRVQVRMGRNRGRLTIEFGGADDLARILALLDPGGTGDAQAGPRSEP